MVKVASGPQITESEPDQELVEEEPVEAMTDLE
jgi:hypothetical protein